MLAKEFIKLGISAAVGLVMGLVPALRDEEYLFLLLGPLYAIGVVYAYKYLLSSLNAIVKYVLNMFSIAVGAGNGCGCVISLAVLAVATVVVLSFAWVIGDILAIIALVEACGGRRMVRGKRSYEESHRQWNDSEDRSYDQQDDDYW